MSHLRESSAVVNLWNDAAETGRTFDSGSDLSPLVDSDLDKVQGENCAVIEIIHSAEFEFHQQNNRPSSSASVFRVIIDSDVTAQVESERIFESESPSIFESELKQRQNKVPYNLEITLPPKVIDECSSDDFNSDEEDFGIRRLIKFANSSTGDISSSKVSTPPASEEISDAVTVFKNSFTCKTLQFLMWVFFMRSNGPVWRFHELIMIFCVVSFVMLTTFFQSYSALHPSILTTRRAAHPRPFFPETSLVEDHFTGDDASVHRLLGTAEVNFVMYYAPWSTLCRSVRLEFDRLARYFPTDAGIRFHGVNCWTHKGECRRSFRMYTYPVMTLYFGTPQEIYYNGLLRGDYMYRFVDAALSPMRVLHTMSELEDFIVQKDHSMIGFFDFYTKRGQLVTDPYGYKNFHFASVKYLEMDPMRDRCQFAIISDRDLADQFNLTLNGEIRFFQLRDPGNVTIYEPWVGGWNSKSILKWLTRRLNDVVIWISPNEVKSEDIFDKLNAGPTLVVFTPRMPLLSQSSLHSQVRESALAYYNCNHSRFVDEAIQLSRRRRHAEPVTLYQWTAECQSNISQLATGRQIGNCCRDIIVSGDLTPPARNICDISNPNKDLWRQPAASSNIAKDGENKNRDGLSQFPVNNLGENVWLRDSAERILSNVMVDIPQLSSLLPLGPAVERTQTILDQQECSNLAKFVPVRNLINFCCDHELACQHPGLACGSSIPLGSTELKKVLKTGWSKEVLIECDQQCLARVRQEGGRLGSVKKMFQFGLGGVQPSIGGLVGGDGILRGGNSVFNSHPLRERFCNKLAFAKVAKYNLRVDDSAMATYPNLTTFLLWHGNRQRQKRYATVEALGCSLNSSKMSFIAMDSMHHFAFAQRMGILAPEKRADPSNWSAVVILDKQNEAMHLLDEALSTQSINAFITNFTYGRLRKRFLRSEMRGDNYDTSEPHHLCQQFPQHLMCLRKVTTKSFKRSVIQSDRDVVLLYMAPWCGACKAVYPTFLTLAYYFRGQRDLSFAFIDASANDLPWEYSVHRLPTIVFFPRSPNGAQSAVFPYELPLTLPNLVAFVLAHAAGRVRASFALSTCNLSCLLRNQRASFRRLHQIRQILRDNRRRLSTAGQTLSRRLSGKGRIAAPTYIPPCASDSECEQHDRWRTSSEDGSLGDLSIEYLQIYIRQTMRLIHKKEKQRRGVRLLILMLEKRISLLDMVYRGGRRVLFSKTNLDDGIVDDLIRWSL